MTVSDEKSSRQGAKNAKKTKTFATHLPCGWRLCVRNGLGCKIATTRLLDYLHGDHPTPRLRASLGSVSLTTDQSGALVSHARYLPYGQEHWRQGETPTDLGFTGQRNDGFGLMDYKARYYSPYLNRFISPDSIVPNPTNPQNFNHYAYSLNNPVRRSDPTGHMVPGDWGKPVIRIDVSSWPSWAQEVTGVALAVNATVAPSLLHYDAEQQAIVGPTKYEAAVASMVGMGLAAIEAPTGAMGEVSASSLIEAVVKEAQDISTKTSSKYLSNNARGPVLSGVMDTQTGETFLGLNKGVVPENLHPILQNRLAQYEADISTGSVTPHFSSPGTHSEIYALNEALYAREARLGRPVLENELGEFLLHNRSLRGTNRIEGVPPRCTNCEYLTNGVTVVER